MLVSNIVFISFAFSNSFRSLQLPIVGNSNTTLVKRSPTFDTFDASCQVYVYSEESGGVELQEREVSNVILHPNLWTYNLYLTKFSRAAAGWWRIPNVSEEHAGSSEEESLPHQVSLCWGQSRRWVFPSWRNYKTKTNLLCIIAGSPTKGVRIQDGETDLEDFDLGLESELEDVKN